MKLINEQDTVYGFGEKDTIQITDGEITSSVDSGNNKIFYIGDSTLKSDTITIKDGVLLNIKVDGNNIHFGMTSGKKGDENEKASFNLTSYSNDGTALFKKVDFKRAKALLLSARDMEMTVGEYLFELLSGDQDSAETLSFYLED